MRGKKKKTSNEVRGGGDSNGEKFKN